MSESGYTPGPWAICHPQGEYSETNGPIVCEVDRLFGASITIRGPQAKMGSADAHELQSTANAHLIAAAPDLLEAPEEAAEVLHQLCPRIPHDGPRNDAEQYEYEVIGGAYSRASAALSKAKGRADG